MPPTLAASCGRAPGPWGVPTETEGAPTGAFGTAVSVGLVPTGPGVAAGREGAGRGAVAVARGAPPSGRGAGAGARGVPPGGLGRIDICPRAAGPRRDEGGRSSAAGAVRAAAAPGAWGVPTETGPDVGNRRFGGACMIIVCSSS